MLHGTTVDRLTQDASVVGLGTSDHQKSGLPEGSPDLVIEASRSKAASNGVAAKVAANFSTAHWPVFPDRFMMSMP